MVVGLHQIFKYRKLWKGITNVNHILSTLNKLVKGTGKIGCSITNFFKYIRLDIHKNKGSLCSLDGVCAQSLGQQLEQVDSWKFPLDTHSRCCHWKTGFSVSSSVRRDEMRSEKSFQSFRLLASNSTKERFKGKNSLIQTKVWERAYCCPQRPKKAAVSHHCVLPFRDEGPYFCCQWPYFFLSGPHTTLLKHSHKCISTQLGTLASYTEASELERTPQSSPSPLWQLDSSRNWLDSFSGFKFDENHIHILLFLPLSLCSPPFFPPSVSLSPQSPPPSLCLSLSIPLPPYFSVSLFGKPLHFLII